jgi:hypothetical protein
VLSGVLKKVVLLHLICYTIQSAAAFIDRLYLGGTSPMTQDASQCLCIFCGDSDAHSLMVSVVVLSRLTVALDPEWQVTAAPH